MTVLVVSATSLLLTVLTSRGTRIALLAVQYAAVARLTGLSLPIQVAAVKLVAGMIACGILAVTESLRDESLPRLHGRELGTSFRFLASILVLVAALGLGQGNWMGIPDISREAILGSTVLMAMGFLQLGLSGSGFRVGIGLVTVISGFEVIYSLIEPSLAVLALIGSVHIGLAMVVSYLALIAETAEVEGETR